VARRVSEANVEAAPPLDEFPLSFSHAFQPIVDVDANVVFAHEALVRGPNGEGAGAVFGRVGADDLGAFDRASQLRALRLAGRLGLDTHLSLNTLPQTITASRPILTDLLATAGGVSVDQSRIVLEITESEAVVDLARFGRAVDDCRGAGLKLALDDFGAGYSGLNLLADFQPDMIKLDMNLVRSIESRGPRQSIVRAIQSVCEDLGIDVIAEGVETRDELEWLRGAGIRLFQGFLFARPAFEALVSEARWT
jgi:EAL domain-containing protein (putative c-di-GMP-specific phosphodiesterase class I)